MRPDHPIYRRHYVAVANAVGMDEAQALFDRLPTPGEIPPVTQEQVFALYERAGSGFGVDEELLAEVESRLLARAEVWLLLHDAISYHLPTTIENLSHEYGLFEVDGNARDVRRGHDAIRREYGGPSAWRRMLAVDALIHAVHDRGPFAANFVEGGESASFFLDELDKWRPSTHLYARQRIPSYRRVRHA